MKALVGFAVLLWINRLLPSVHPKGQLPLMKLTLYTVEVPYRAIPITQIQGLLIMQSKYEFQIKVRKDRVMQWVSVRPKGGQPYQYDTETEAHQAADMCYGGAFVLTRIIEVQSHGE